MNNIQEFIQTASQQLGTTEQSTRSATGGLMAFIQGQVKESDFSQLVNKIPGADGILKEASKPAAQSAGAGGMLGGLAGQAVSAVGGKAASSAGILQTIQQSGFDMGKVAPFVSLFLNFAKQKAGSDLAGRVFEQIPDLKKLAG